MPGMTWNAEADQKLLLFILFSNPTTTLNYTAAASMLSQGDATCTEEAIRQHIKKLKKMAKDDKGLQGVIDASSNGSLQVAKGTPRSGKKKNARVVDDDDDDQSGRPSKKRKITKKPTTQLDTDDGDEEEDIKDDEEFKVMFGPNKVAAKVELKDDNV